MAFRVSLVCVLLLASAGCAGTSPAAPRATASTEGGEASLGRLADENAVLTSRVETLEARLLALEVQNDELHTLLDRASERASVRIGDRPRAAREEPDLTVHPDPYASERASRPDAAEDEPEDAPEPRSGSRPVLTLSGPPPAPTPTERPALAVTGTTLAGPAAPAVVLPPPSGALGRLLVTGSPSDVPAIPIAPVTVLSGAPTETDRIAAEYQSALRLLSGRDLSGALTALERFAASHPDHPYADNAHYFRGEIFYSQHDYRSAIRELELLVSRYPSGGRVADALLRIGTCWERLGDSARAAHYFERVRTEHPDSSAARMAEREDT
jgi:tol-pal system protein YbgF